MLLCKLRLMKKKLFLFIAVVSLSLMTTACSMLQNIDKERAVNAGAAGVSAFLITDSQVSALCKEYMVEMDGENSIAPATSIYTKRLNTITKRFKNISNMTVNFAVYQSSTVNAFACGDGSVRVYSGLMDQMTDDEIFAVIGHELGHLNNKDTRDNYRNAYLAVAVREGIAAVDENAALITEGIIGDIAQEIALSAYSREQEYQADKAAFNYCTANNVDPYAMQKALNVLVKLNGSSNSGIVAKVSQMFSTHPDSAKRAARIKTMADEYVAAHK
jgi:metalloprotease